MSKENRSKRLTMDFESQLLHAGHVQDGINSCAVPIYSSAAFGFNDCAHGADLLNLNKVGSIYSRFTNPTVSVLQNRIAALEGGVAACAVASGSAAVANTVSALAMAGDNIVSSINVHGGTLHMFKSLLQQSGIECRFIDSDDPADYGAAIDERTKFVFVESISNPQYAVPDFERLADIAHQNGIPLVCDNTFGCAGYFCQPLRFGVDIVVHSATKWIGGHGTTVGGLIVDKGAFDWGASKERFPQFNDPTNNLWEKYQWRAFAVRCQWEILRDLGSTLSATSAQQLLIGLESLAVRCERHAYNTAHLADWLASQPEVGWVSYLGNPMHPYHTLAKRYLQKGFGAVLSFGIKGGKAASFQVCDALQMIITTTNLGDSKTLVLHPATTTHEPFTDTERKAAGVTDDLIRLSVGIENVEDIKQDFRQAMDRIYQPHAPRLTHEQATQQQKMNQGFYSAAVSTPNL